MIRLFQTEQDQELTNNIAEFTNSQNAISSVDLKSISNLQIQIEAYLKNESIQYVRKAGDVREDPSTSKPFPIRISMEKLAQIIYASNGFPDRATSQKKALFEKYYDDIFGDNLVIDSLPNLVREYNKIENKYTELHYDGFHSKYLYVLFLEMSENPPLSIQRGIKKLEDALNAFNPDSEHNGSPISAARKLIRKDFKKFLLEGKY